MNVTGGTVTLGQTTGLTFLPGGGDGTNDSTMIFTGKIGDINDAIPNSIFTVTPDFHGDAKIAITLDDQANTGVRVPPGPGNTNNWVVSNTLTITVNSINDDPVNTVPGSQTIIETTPTALTTPISVTDKEAVAESKPVAVTLQVTKGKVKPFHPHAHECGRQWNARYALSFQGLVGAVNTALTTLKYTANAFPQTDTLTVTTSDLGASGGTLLIRRVQAILTNTDTITLNVIPERMPAAIPDQITINEGAAATPINVLAQRHRRDRAHEQHHGPGGHRRLLRRPRPSAAPWTTTRPS